MPHQTIVEYPRYISITEAIEIAKKLVSTFKGNSISKEALATALQHSNASSGTFLVKLSDLKKYGILEGRGDAFYTTDIAKKIAIPTDQNEKDNAIKEMINNVKILPQLYEALRLNVAPTQNDILIHLITITKRDRSELQPLLAEISKLYKDALSYISVSDMAQSSTQTVMQEPQSQSNIPIQVADKTKEILTFMADGISLKVINDTEHLEKIKKFVKLYLPENDTDTSNKTKHQQK